MTYFPLQFSKPIFSVFLSGNENKQKTKKKKAKKKKRKFIT